MTKTIRFTKMHGAGNDYIYVESDRYPIESPEQAAIKWSDRHTGIGSDGLVLIEKSDVADFRMRIFNADGSEAMMCGNASRCVGKYLFEKGLTSRPQVALETLSGIKILKLHVAAGVVESVTVDMGEPMDIKEVDLGEGYASGALFVSMGNPHLVNMVPHINSVDLPVIGPALEHHPLFPGRVNVEFAELIAKDTLRMRVWERGSGITLACGTGACATAVAAMTKGLTARKADVLMDGGKVTIAWDEQTGHVFKTGPAEFVFEGEIVV